MAVSKIELVDSVKTYEITLDQTAIDIQLTIVRFTEALIKMNELIAIDELKVIQDDSDPTLYDYQIILKDGRRWQQNLFNEGSSLSMTFNIPDKWFLEELIPHRDIRLAITEMILRADLVDLKVEFS